MRSEPTQTQAAPRYDLGLVLEGGAIRGIYTAGVLDVLMAHGLQADMVIGTSAGCIHGCNFVSGPGRAQHPLLPQIPPQTGISWGCTPC